MFKATIIHDVNGKNPVEFPCHSFVENVARDIFRGYANISTLGLITLSGEQRLAMYGHGVDVYTPVGYYGFGICPDTGLTISSSYGILPGVSNSTFDISQHTFTSIPGGSGNGQLQYSQQVVVPPEISGDLQSCWFSFGRSFVNAGETPISINELALVGRRDLCDLGVIVAIYARDVLESPVILNQNDSYNVTYKYKISL
jgi:hypothetical protein